MMRPGDIVLTAGDQMVSRVIRAVTFSDFSHVIAHIDMGLLMEAVEHGVIIRRARGFYVTEREYVKVLRLTTPLTPAQADAIKRSIEDRLGRAYSKLAAVRTVIRLIPYDPRSATFCSRLLLEGFRDNGIDILPGVTADEVQPKHFESSPLLTNITESAVRHLDPISDKDEYDTVVSFSGTTTETIAGLLGRRVVEMLGRGLPASAWTRIHSFLDLLNWLSDEARNDRAQLLRVLDSPLFDALTKSGYFSFLAHDLPTQRELLKFLAWAADSAEAFDPAELNPSFKALGDWLYQEYLNGQAVRELNRKTADDMQSLASATGLKSIARLASIYSERQSLGDKQDHVVERLSRALRRQV